MGWPWAHGCNLTSPQGEPGQRGTDGATGLRVSKSPLWPQQGDPGPRLLKTPRDQYPRDPREAVELQEMGVSLFFFFFFNDHSLAIFKFFIPRYVLLAKCSNANMENKSCTGRVAGLPESFLLRCKQRPSVHHLWCHPTSGALSPASRFLPVSRSIASPTGLRPFVPRRY